MKDSGKHHEPKVVVRLYDFTLWLLQRTNRFPKNWRVTLGDRTDNLDEFKLLIRICHDLGCLKTNQYKYASKETEDIGKQLGGWIKQQAK